MTSHEEAVGPDGTVVSVLDNPAGFIGPWAFVSTLTIRGSTYRLTTGAAGSFEAVSLSEPGTPITLALEGEYRGSRIAAYEEETGSTLLLTSRYHEMSTFVHGKVASLDPFVRLLEELHLSDGLRGFQIRPRAGSGNSLRVFGALNSIPSTFGVTVRSIASDPSIIPRHRGAKVRGGEVWVHEARTEEGARLGRVYVLANESCAAHLVDLEKGGSRAAEVIETIRFDYRDQSLEPATTRSR